MDARFYRENLSVTGRFDLPEGAGHFEVSGTKTDTSLGPREIPVLRMPPKIGRYELRGELGRGSIGIVYRALDSELGREVAIKLLHDHRTFDPDSKARFRREARALARLSHPNVVQVYEVGDHEAGVYIVMELVEGMTLRDWNKQGEPDWRAVVELFIQIALGLHAAHMAGLVHRDFKPDNVMVGDEGRPRILDFGLVRSETTPVSPPSLAQERRADPLATNLTHVDSLLGTPAYMAPEQHERRPVDARSDQFAFSVSLFEALYKKRPFNGRDLATLKQQCLGSEFVDIPGTDVPAWVHEIVMRGLCVDPGQRYAGMEALILALRDDPARARKRWIVASVVTVSLAIGAWGLWSGTQAHAVSPCEADPSLGGVWTQARQQEAEDAFAATKLGYAADTWERTGAQLGHVAKELSAQRLQVCVDRRGAQLSDATLDRRSQCIKGIERTVDFALERFSKAQEDPELVERALDLMTRIPDPAGCRDDQSLARRAASKVVLMSGEELNLVEAADAELDQIELDLAAPNSPTRARALVARAADSPSLRLRARSRRVLAFVLRSHNRMDEARPLMEMVQWESLAHENAGRAAEIITQVARNLSRHEDEQARFDRTMKLARALITRAGDPNKLLTRFFDVEGYRRYLLQDGPGSLEAADAALAVFEGTPTQELLLRHARVLALNALGRADEALDEAKAMHRRSVEIFGPAHPQALHWHNTLGLVVANVEGGLAAIEVFRAAREIAKQEGGRETLNYTQVTLNLAVSLDETGSREEALEIAKELLVLAQGGKLRDPVMVGESLNLIGVIEDRLGRYEDAHAHLVRAVEESARVMGPNQVETAVFVISRADVEFHQEKYDLALASYKRAGAVLRDKLGPDHPHNAYVHYGLGIVHIERGELADARRELDRAVELRGVGPSSAHELAEAQGARARAWLAKDRNLARAAAVAALEAFDKDPSAREDADKFRAWAGAEFGDM